MLFKNFNSSRFKGARAPSFGSYEKIVKIVNSKIDGTLASDLADKVRKFAPKMVDSSGIVQKRHFLYNFGEAVKKPFVEIPSAIIEKLYKLLPKSKIVGKWHLANLPIIEGKKDKLYERAARGLYQWGEEFVKKAGGEKITNASGEICKDVSKAVTSGFYEQFAKNLAFDKANYNTITERTGTRIVSGFIPAIFLGLDFHNKSVRDGLSEDEIKKKENQKRGQEISASLGEAAAQYAVLSSFPNYVNTSQMGAPIINTLIGLFFHVQSRLSKGMPLTRVKIKEQSSKTPKTIEEFSNYLKVKSSTDGNYFGSSFKPDGISTVEQKPKKQKGRVLTPKNILLFCAASIAAGLAIKFGKPKLAKTEFGEFLKNIIKPAKKLFKNATEQKLWVNEESLKQLFDKMDETGNNKLSNHYKRVVKNILDKYACDETMIKVNNGVKEICLGEVEKTFNLFGVEKLKVTRKDAYTAVLFPFKIIKEVVSYPYKAFDSIMKAIAGKAPKKIAETAFVKAFKKVPDSPDKLNGLMYFYRDFQKHQGDFIKNPKLSKFKDFGNFNEFYKDHLFKNILHTLDREGNSKINNAEIGKLTQLLGTGASVYFAMTDDYNRTAKSTNNKAQAQRDARERGVNKFFRIATQIALMDVFYKTFKIPYAKNLLGALGLTAACTAATDVASRWISGMPFKEMKTKEEFQAWREKERNGPFGWRIKFVDWLSK